MFPEIMQVNAGICRLRSVRRGVGVLGVMCMLFAASACSTPETTTVVAASPTAITLTTIRFNEPTAVAEAHCAKYGRKAVSQGGGAKLGSVGYKTMWGYDCVDK